MTATSRTVGLGAAAALTFAAVLIGLVYSRDLARARRRVSTGSRIAQTKCGPIEYADRGVGSPVLVVHGAGGGFDQGLLLAQPLAQHGHRVIAMSRFGYLRTPLPANASAEAQADAHACLLDALGIDRAAVFGVSAGGPSSLQFCLRHAERCSAMVLLVPLAYSGKEPERLSPGAQWLMERLMASDFLFWASSHVLRTRMVESVLGTPIDDVRGVSEPEQRRIYEVLDAVLPVSLRAKGLLNEGAVARALRPLPLERITAPTLIASVENDGYRTYAGARYTADHISGARFIGYARGGHLLVGHDEEFLAEVVKFLDARNAGMQ